MDAMRPDLRLLTEIRDHLIAVTTRTDIYDARLDRRGYSPTYGSIALYNDDFTPDDECVVDGELTPMDANPAAQATPSLRTNTSVEVDAVTATIASPVGAGTAAAAVRTTSASDDPLNTILGAQADAASATTTIKAALRNLVEHFGGTYGQDSIGVREDAAFNSAALGIQSMGQRQDTPANSAGTTGDSCTLGVSPDGGQWVEGVFKAGTAIVDADISADYTSAYQDCRGFNLVYFALQFADDSAGELYFQGSLDGSSHPIDLPIGANGVFKETGGVAWTGVTFTGPDTNITIADPGASGSKILVAFENPPPYIRFFFDRTGGTATGLDSQSALQAK